MNEPTAPTAPPYLELRKIDVSAKIERKEGLAYLSWAFAVDQLLQSDPTANWIYPAPTVYPDGTVMVYCAVTAFGKTMQAHLPVMIQRKKEAPCAIQNPDAFAINTAMQRCLVKAIALHGIGLYIYAGEDLPAESPNHVDPRGEGHNQVPVAEVRAGVQRVQHILAKDIDEDARALEIFDAHCDFNRDSDAYIAIGDALDAQKVMTKAAWRKYVNTGKKLAERPIQ